MTMILRKHLNGLSIGVTEEFKWLKFKMSCSPIFFSTSFKSLGMIKEVCEIFGSGGSGS